MDKFKLFLTDKFKIIISLFFIISLIGFGYIAYLQINKVHTCHDVLKNMVDNRLCISTNYGNIIFELYVDAAPIAIKNLKKLANDDKFYDNTEIYSVSKDIMFQFGLQDFMTRTSNNDLLDDESNRLKNIYNSTSFEVEANWSKLDLSEELKKQLTESNYKSNEELNSRKFEYGSISFSSTGYDKNNPDIFVLTVSQENLDQVKDINGAFTNFGKLIEGTEVVEKINSISNDSNYPIEFSAVKSKPSKTIKIFNVRVK